MADQIAHLAHLNARDTTFVFASGAPQSDIERYRRRMGWDIPWFTITDHFDADLGVDEWHGTNAFIRDGDDIYHTCFIDGRGDEGMGTTWAYLDITALACLPGSFAAGGTRREPGAADVRGFVAPLGLTLPQGQRRESRCGR